MAAPMAGELIANILDYLGYEKSGSDVNANGVTIPHLVGKTPEEARTALNNLGLNVRLSGEGAVVTDWGGSNDHALGVKNGSTLEMPCPGDASIRELVKAVETGKITEADVDARLEELLELVFTTKAAVDAAPSKFDAAAHHALARQAAAQSIVLLKNQDSLLPLTKGETVAVIGDFA